MASTREPNPGSLISVAIVGFPDERCGEALHAFVLQDARIDEREFARAGTPWLGFGGN